MTDKLILERIEDTSLVFNNPLFGRLRVLVNNEGEIFFVGVDLSQSLGYLKTDSMYRRLEHHQKMMIDPHNVAISGFPRNAGEDLEPNPSIHKMVLVTEGGMWDAIMGSHLPDAKVYKNWITDEVLPAIRKTGSYTLPNAPVEVNQAMIDAVMGNKLFAYQLMGKNIEQEAKITELEIDVSQKQLLLEQKEEVISKQKPKVKFADLLTADKTLIEVGTVARRISVQGHIVGRNRLFAFMRTQDLLMKVKGNDNMPKQTYIDRGYFISKPVVLVNSRGIVKDKTFFTAKGLYWFVDNYYKKLFPDEPEKEIEEIQLSIMGQLKKEVLSNE